MVTVHARYTERANNDGIAQVVVEFKPSIFPRYHCKSLERYNEARKVISGRMGHIEEYVNVNQYSDRLTVATELMTPGDYISLLDELRMIEKLTVESRVADTYLDRIMLRLISPDITGCSVGQR